jgi:cyclase
MLKCFVRLTATFLFGACSAGAQGITDSGARVERIAEGVFAIIHDDALKSWPAGGTDWPHGNTGVIVGDDGVLVIDATFHPSRAVADIALIRRLTNKPVRFLVNTHWHGDHTHGNGVYKDSFPNIRIISSRPNRDWIRVNQLRFRARSTQASYPSRELLSQLEGMLSRGTDSAGTPLTAERRATIQRFVVERRADVDDMPKMKSAPPDSVFDGRLTITLGRRRVELRDRGHANSPSDVTVYLPTERVLFTGDIVVHPIPYAFASYPKPWIPVLRDLEAMAPAFVVPGHGPVMRDVSYIRLVRELIEHVATVTEPFVVRGATADSARLGIDLTIWRRRFDPQLSPVLTEMWEESIVNSLVPRVFLCIQGTTC